MNYSHDIHTRTKKLSLYFFVDWLLIYPTAVKVGTEIFIALAVFWRLSNIVNR